MLKPGDTFERYTVDAMIGQGGMGCVYRAHDARLERRVALKVISDATAPSPEADARLLREARSAAALDHPNAVSIFDVGELDGAPYIVMELVEGQTLRESVGDAALPLATRAGWLADAGRALAAAHKRGLVHRDVKPENVMVRTDGVVKVLDFGIARRQATEVDPSAATALPTLTREGVRMGTPLYMAPEQIRGDALDGRADQFAWGVVAYELFAGRLPWRGGVDALAVAASILTDEPPEGALDAAGVPAGAKAAVLRALAKRQEDRFASMEDAVRALEAGLRGEAPAPSAPPAKKAPPPGVTDAKRYTTGEVKEILSRAIDRQEDVKKDGRLAFEDLLAAAEEVGVDPETLREASRDLRRRDEDLALGDDDGAARAAWLRRKRTRFYRHLGIYLIVNAALLLLGLITGGFPFNLIPALGWGIGVAIHGLTALTANDDDWRELREWRRRRELKRTQREQKVERAIDEGVSLLLRTGETIRKRVDAGAAAKPKAQVRIETGGARARQEAEAEAEAAAEEAEGKRRRRR